MTNGTQKYRFEQVFDYKGKRVRGLWKRNGAFYAQIRRTGEAPRRIRLKAATIAKAIEERYQARGMPLPPQTPRGESLSLREAIGGFMDWLMASSRPALTIKSRRLSFDRWEGFLGPDAGLVAVTMETAHRFSDHRIKTVSIRTAQNDVSAMKTLTRWALERGYLPSDPLSDWKVRRPRAREIRLVTPAEVDRLCAGAIGHFSNGRLLADYIRLLQYSGGREQETLKLRWENVDWDRRRLGFGQYQRSKFGKSRWMPFNPALEGHLKELYSRRRKGCPWVFPGRDGNCLRSLSSKLIRLKAILGIRDFGWHHLRHHFISRAVMSGVDVRTIADWVGHADKGVTIARTYAHLSDEHSAAQAKKVRFTN